MFDSQEALIVAAIVLAAMHSGVAAYLLISTARQTADWQIRPHRAVLGQMAVFLVALFFTAGFVQAFRVVSLLGTVESFLLAPVLFLVLCWIGQSRMINYLAAYHGRRKFLHSWKLRRIGLSTMIKIIYFYICISLVLVMVLTYAEWAKQNAAAPTTQQHAAAIIAYTICIDTTPGATHHPCG